MIFGTGACTFDVLFTLGSMPNFRSTVMAQDFTLQLGGPVANALVGLSRFGLLTKAFGEVGDDEAGRQIVKWLVREKVDVEHLRLRDQSTSRVVLALVDARTGDRSFIFRPDSFIEPSIDILDRIDFTTCRLLIVDEATDFSIEAARRCKKSGGKVLFAGGWYRGLIGLLLEHADFFIISREFLRDWARKDGASHSLEEFFTRGNFRFGIQTNGEKGCILQTPLGGSRGLPTVPAVLNFIEKAKRGEDQ